MNRLGSLFYVRQAAEPVDQVDMISLSPGFEKITLLSWVSKNCKGKNRLGSLSYGWVRTASICECIRPLSASIGGE